MNAQKYLKSHWGTGGIAHSQMIQFLEEYADIKLADAKRNGIKLNVSGRSELLLDFFRKHCEEYHENWTEYDIMETVNRYLKKQAVAA